MSKPNHIEGEGELLPTREQCDEAQALQRKGATLTEIAKVLDVDRDAVVECLYVAVINRRPPRVIEIVAPKAPYAGSTKAMKLGKVRLKAGDGRWLHMSGEGLTLVRADSWLGTPEQLFHLRQRYPNLNSLTVSEP
jgi:hypothetical protein